MSSASSKKPDLRLIPQLVNESLYVGIDVGKYQHVAGFVSKTLLQRHVRFEACPALKFENSREGFRLLAERIREYVALEHCYVLLEQTGHYHRAIVQYLLELDLPIYLMHVQSRPVGLLKTDKRDALHLANHLFNQLELGVQVSDKTQLVRRAIPPTESAALLRNLVRHRYELSHESTQRKNKLIAICDELFPEFTQVCKDPNLPSALSIREQFPTPHVLATASFAALCAARVGRRPAEAKLVDLQRLAAQSIGTKDLGRQRGLVFEQRQLIRELRVIEEHLQQIDEEVRLIIAQSREGRMLTSIPPIGPIQAATLIATIGHIDNFPTAATLKAYLGWAPMVTQTGISLDQAKLTKGGARPAKKMLFLIVGNAIQMKDSEWAKLYERLVPRMCMYDEARQVYRGKVKVMARIAGQIIAVMYALLKKDAELLHKLGSGGLVPEPMLYDPAIHQAHRQGKYRSMKPRRKRNTIVDLAHPLPS